MSSIERSSSKTHEQYLFPQTEKLNSLNISNFTEIKRSSWQEELENARKNTTFLSPEDLVQASILGCKESKKKCKGIIILDFHNVFDSDLSKFVKQCSKWRNENNFEVHICSFVGKGTPVHASLLAFFDDPCIQTVLTSLIVVFDRRHALKGKGHIVKKLFTNLTLSDMSKIPIFFVDDGIENILNVYEATKSFSNVHLIHYVAVSETKKVMTPSGAKRVNSFSNLCEIILSPVQKKNDDKYSL